MLAFRGESKMEVHARLYPEFFSSALRKPDPSFPDKFVDSNASNLPFDR
jgi:hypothetical protein